MKGMVKQMSKLKKQISKIISYVYPRYVFHLEILAIVLVFIFALLIRLNFVFNMNHPELVTDAYNYDVMTKQFLDKGFLGYLSDEPNAVITPGFPLFLSIIYSIFGYENGSPLTQVRVIQSILGSLTCILMYLIGKKIKNRKVGLITAISYAIYPAFAWSNSLILTETLYNFLFFLYFYVQLIVLDKKTPVLSVICGILFAAAVLVRPLVFPLLVVPFIYDYIIHKDKRIIKSFLFTAAGTLLLMIPWWIRNIVTLNKFILLATQTGNPLIAGAFPYYSADISKYNVENQFLSGIKYIMEGFITQPLLYLKWFTIGKFNYIFGTAWFHPPEDFTFLRSLWLFHYVIISLGWLGVVFSIIKNRHVLISIFIILLTGLQLLFVPEWRYAYSIIPFLMLLMASLIDYILWSSKPSDT